MLVRVGGQGDGGIGKMEPLVRHLEIELDEMEPILGNGVNGVILYLTSGNEKKRNSWGREENSLFI